MKRNSKIKRVKLISLMGLVALLITVQCKSEKETNITVYSSSMDGDRLTKQADLKFSMSTKADVPEIRIDTTVRFQKIDGFGASFNEAGMICLNSLSDSARENVLKLLFDPEIGAGYTLMKSPIAACDFASAGPWYSYNDTPGDTAMTKFSIKRDLGPNGLISYIKAASRYGNFEIQSPMDFAPDWMYFSLKKGEKHIKPEYYPALAKYYLKYLQAYKEKGVNIGYMNLFNEGHNEWYSNVTYAEMGEMIKKHVGPLFKANGIETKIQLGETAFRPEAMQKFPVVLDDQEARKYIHSLTVHGYEKEKRYDSLTVLHNNYPEFPIWMTEICYVKPPVSEFSDGEYWGNMIMNDMKNWVSGWIYWNMILDTGGGPWLTSVEHGDPDNNRQHSVVIIDRDTKKITYTGLYYYLAHFSKFIKPGAYRINSTGGTDQLNYGAFINSDGSIIVNIINNGDETECKIAYGEQTALQQLKAHSITTLKWNTANF